MFAIIRTGGHQYRVEPGQFIDVDLRKEEPGTAIEIADVLMLVDDAAVAVGSPNVAGAVVKATVLRSWKGEKIVVFRYKPKVRYRRRTGHRSTYTRLRINSLEGVA